MAIKFQNAQGTGTLDVAAHLAENFPGAEITGVENGLVVFKDPNGKVGRFSLGQWAESTGATIIEMNGFNSPDTALDQPPVGMNYLDQSAFYMDGQNMEALQEMFPQALKKVDGAVVVLDSDGMWRTMWSPYIQQPLPAPAFAEMVDQNMVQDPKLAMRVAGITFMFALAGIEPGTDNNGNFKVDSLVKAIKVIARNAPYENKVQIGKLLHQTTGLDPWKFNNACLAPEETGEWLKMGVKATSFQYRMKQADLAELMLEAMRGMAKQEFAQSMKQLVKLPETKALLINLKTIFGEFVQFLIGLDLLRDISRTTGLNEWIALNEDSSFDPTKLPPMPKFVEAFVKMLRWMLPIVKEKNLAFAKGKKGFMAVLGLEMMIDDCIYSLAGIPDSSAKYKMFMALKRLQTQIETKLSFIYQPSPDANKDGMKENPFMKAKAFYSEKRETLYKLCQLPKESWNNTLLQSLRETQNLEVFYDSLPKTYGEMMKSFAAMDAAYDMQPWVDLNHAERTHDPFSQYNESFGLPPPEAGYLAKNSPRAAFNIAETLVEGAGVISSASEAATKEMLRNPWLLANLLKTLQVASVNRELGTVEVLSKFGITAMNDKWSSPDSHRIWEDPEAVQKDVDRQVQELMGSMAMEAMMQQQGQQQQDQQAQVMQEQARGEEEPQEDVAGPGPSGPPQRAVPMRR